MAGRRLLALALISAVAMAACGSDEGGGAPALPADLSDASTRLQSAGFEVEAQTVDVLAKSTPVLVVTDDSSASALVAEKEAARYLPEPAAGVSTTLSTYCENGLVYFSPKDFPSEQDLTKGVCSAG